MSDNVGIFDLQAIVTQIFVILTSKMVENGSKLTPKRVCFKKNGKNLYQKAHNSTEYGIVVWYWNQFCRNISECIFI